MAPRHRVDQAPRKAREPLSELFEAVYRRLFARFGPQHWWPASTPFEMAVGAILTQSVAWRNVEQAIANLKAGGLLDPHALAGAPLERIAEAIRPARYFRQKADRLQRFARHLVERYGGSVGQMLEGPTASVRSELLSLPGIGPETADSILLYGGGHPVFVVDAYTRRIFHRIGVWDERIEYAAMQDRFHRSLPEDPALFNEYHALIVRTGNEYCKARRPRCRECPLAGLCAAGAPPAESKGGDER